MDSKGPIIQRFERVTDEAARRTVARRGVLVQAVGTVQMGAKRTTGEVRAQENLPEYVHVGMAQGPLALQYWSNKLAELEPKDYTRFNKEMVRLLPDHWQEAVLSAPPEVLQQGRWLREQGLGPQPVQPPVAQQPVAPSTPLQMPRIPSMTGRAG